MKKGSLKSKFVWLAALVILIPLAVTNTVAVRLYRQLVNSSLQNLNYNNIVHVGITTENYIYNSNELATYIIANNHIRQFLLSDPTDPHYAERISDAAAILSSFPVSSRFISKATVFSNSGVSINNNNYSSLTITEQQKEQALKLNGHLFWILEKNKNNEDTLVLCRSIRDTRHLSRQIGFLKVSLNMETLRDLLTPPKDLEEIS
ncbi:MAG: hypothetical protein RR528_02875, partial [Angelakisella sp.]